MLRFVSQFVKMELMLSFVSQCVWSLVHVCSKKRNKQATILTGRCALKKLTLSRKKHLDKEAIITTINMVIYDENFMTF